MRPVHLPRIGPVEPCPTSHRVARTGPRTPQGVPLARPPPRPALPRSHPLRGELRAAAARGTRSRALGGPQPGRVRTDRPDRRHRLRRGRRPGPAALDPPAPAARAGHRLQRLRGGPHHGRHPRPGPRHRRAPAPLVPAARRAGPQRPRLRPLHIRRLRSGSAGRPDDGTAPPHRPLPPPAAHRHRARRRGDRLPAGRHRRRGHAAVRAGHRPADPVLPPSLHTRPRAARLPAGAGAGAGTGPWPRRGHRGPPPGAGPRGRDTASVTTTRTRHPYLDHPGPIAFAHRGGDADGLENTAAQFRRAADAGYRYMETDVHVTADGVLVAFHDDTLDRVTDGTGRISELPWSEVRQARVAGREPVPLLGELLETFPGVRWNVDVKEEGALLPLLELLEATASWDRVCVGSFSESRVARAQRLAGPRLATSLGTAGVLGLRLCSWGLPVGPRTSALAAQVPVAQSGIPVVDRRFVRAAHARGLQVHVWTINDSVEMHRLLDQGVDGIMTDHIDTLRAVMEDRGVWA
ncbi:glycerophosphodiester phosphodiesterase [Streptomyces sp. UH6]|nr:glycerophosphodiester phosphodiesterase [Streptomyces sp. UH6]